MTDSTKQADGELRERLASVLMTPNQSWRGMKKIPIEVVWGLEEVVRDFNKNVLEQAKAEIYEGGSLDEVAEASRSLGILDKLIATLTTTQDKPNKED